MSTAAATTTTTTTASVVATTGTSTEPTNATKGPPSAVEFEPPLACVRRILKNSLPASTNVGKDASAAFARASGIFIIYLTACANDFARENRRQTITANDVLAAIKELEFDEFTPELETFLEQYREAEKSKKAAKAAAAAAKDGGEDEEEEEETTPTPTPTPSNEKGGAATPQSEKSKDSKMMSLEEDPVVEEEKGEDKNNGDQEGKGGDVEDMEE